MNEKEEKGPGKIDTRAPIPMNARSINRGVINEVEGMVIGWEVFSIKDGRHPVRIKCEYGGNEAFGEFSIDAIAMARLTPSSFAKTLIRLAMATIKTAHEHPVS